MLNTHQHPVVSYLSVSLSISLSNRSSRAYATRGTDASRSSLGSSLVVSNEDPEGGDPCESTESMEGHGYIIDIQCGLSCPIDSCSSLFRLFTGGKRLRVMRMKELTNGMDSLFLHSTCPMHSMILLPSLFSSTYRVSSTLTPLSTIFLP